jgi:hypothetical protein
VPGRFLAIVVVGFALAMVCPSPVAAVSVSFDGEVLRYRESDDSTQAELSVDPIDGWPTRQLHLRFSTSPSPGRETILGCAGGQLPGPPGREEDPSGTWNLACPLRSPPPGPVRYRFSFEGRDPAGGFGIDDELNIALAGPAYRAVRGVVYGGVGNDDVDGGDRVYGGPGHDFLDGARVSGGPGTDYLTSDVATYIRRTVVLRGESGDDELYEPGTFFGTGGEGGRLYGGSGSDELEATNQETPSRVLLVGGPGSDVIRFRGHGRSVVVRVRGGGVDRVNCGLRADFGDALFVDRIDRLSPGCKDATVLYVGRPRYPYP